MEAGRDHDLAAADLSETRLLVGDQVTEINSIIELHDSWIVGVVTHGNSILVKFGPAYIHRSRGRPGIDQGTGWVQELELIFDDAVLQSEFTEIPCQLEGGTLSIEGHVVENAIPLPIDVRGTIRFSSVSMNGATLVIVGNRIQLGRIQEAVYVEEFPGGT